MIPIISLFLCINFLSLTCTNADSNLRTAFVPFGKLTNQFLWTIQPNIGKNITLNLIFNYFGNASNLFDGQEALNNYWKTYIGYFILMAIGLLFIVFFTLVGCCFCCCRCCCKRCGVKPPKQTEKQAKTKRIVFNVFLFLLTTLILIGGIVAMASNFILLEAFKPLNNTSDKDGNIMSNINSTVHLAISYINYLANNGISNGTSILSNSIQNLTLILTNVGNLFIQTFKYKLNTTAMFDVSDTIIKGYSDLTIQAENLSYIAQTHKVESINFTQYLNDFSLNLNETLKNQACITYAVQCDKLRALLPLSIGYDMTKINYTEDIEMKRIVKSFNISDFQNAKENTSNTVANTVAEINSTIQGYINNATNSSGGISNFAKNFNDSFAMKDGAITFLTGILGTINKMEIGNGTVYSYFCYVFYAFLVLIGIILLIVLLFYVGLSFGVIGQPNFEKASYCNRGVGSGFLMGAIAISFMTGWIIMLVATVMFVSGGVIQTEACRYITVGANNQTLEATDSIINRIIAKFNTTYEMSGIQFTLPKVDFAQSILNNCPTSTDLLSAFMISIEYFRPISDSLFQKFVSPQLESVKEKLKSYKIPDISTGQMKNNLDRLQTIIGSMKAVNSTSSIIELSKNVTNATNFNEFVTALFQLANDTSSSNLTFSDGLRTAGIKLLANVTNMVTIHTTYKQLKMATTDTINMLDNQLKVLDLMLSFIKNNVSDAKTAAESSFGSEIMNNTKSLMFETIKNVVQSLGNCQGLAAVVNSAVGILCTTFLIPFNNIWMGVGWFLLFIIPAIIFSVKLHALYRISKVESIESNNNKAYERSNNLITVRDMELIRMKRPRQI